MEKSLSIVFFFLFLYTGFSQQPVHVTSPDGRIAFNFEINNGIPVYSISFKKGLLIENSAMNLELEEIGKFINAFVIQKPVVKEVNESYKLIVGKASNVKARYKQATILLGDELKKNIKVNIEVKVFNDGLAFRYVLPKQEGQTSFTLLEEQ